MKWYDVYLYQRQVLESRGYTVFDYLTDFKVHLNVLDVAEPPPPREYESAPRLGLPG